MDVVAMKVKGASVRPRQRSNLAELGGRPAPARTHQTVPSLHFLHQLFVVAREGLTDTWVFQNHIRQIADAKNRAAFLTT